MFCSLFCQDEECNSILNRQTMDQHPNVFVRRSVIGLLKRLFYIKARDRYIVFYLETYSESQLIIFIFISETLIYIFQMLKKKSDIKTTIRVYCEHFMNKLKTIRIVLQFYELQGIVRVCCPKEKTLRHLS